MKPTISNGAPTSNHRPPFIAPGSIEELDGFEPTPEQAAARRRLELSISLAADGRVSWAGDPLRSIMGVYGFRPDWNIPEIPLASGPARWLASAISAVDSPNPFLMNETLELPPLAQQDRAHRVARRLAGLAGVEHVRVVWLAGLHRANDSAERHAV
ncbi:hypothetical protein [Frigoribacterium sp. UYMn621]|uniref:hypothetical protein n=1 Tax=Frigoribacterium sp. UYMn621 TaxID=3156343 RepID=UPI0033921676